MAARFTYARLSPESFRDTLAGLSITPMGFARITGTNPRTVQRWLSGAMEIPPWAGMVLYVWTESPETVAICRTHAAFVIRSDALRPGVAYPYRANRHMPLDGPEEV